MEELRKTPFNEFAENALLGILLLDNKRIVTALDLLTSNDFYLVRNQLIFVAITDVYKFGSVVDYVSVIDMLKKNDQLEKAGGLSHLLLLNNFVASTDSMDTYINIIKESSLKRQLIEAASKIVESGYSSQNLQEIIDEAEKSIFAIGQKRNTGGFENINFVLNSLVEKIVRRKATSSAITGLATGFALLDYFTSGFQPEELIILAARPSVGKSALAFNLALEIASKNKSKDDSNSSAGVALFSLEMSNEQTALRLLSNVSYVEQKQLKAGPLSITARESLEVATETLSKLNIYFNDSPGATIGEIRAKCRKLKNDGKLDFVIIDYLQLITPDSKNPNRNVVVGEISRGLKLMARELKIPVLALSQLSRGIEMQKDGGIGSREPELSDLRESGSIEQDADIVMFIHRDKDADRSQAYPVKLIVAKNRQGELGKMDMIFDPKYAKFSQAERLDSDE